MIAYPPSGKPSVDEIVERGERIYRERLRDVLEPEQNGKFVVIDVESGEYDVGDNCRAVSDRVAAKHPGAPLYAGRVGFPTTYRVGFNGAAVRQ